MKINGHKNQGTKPKKVVRPALADRQKNKSHIFRKET